MSFDYKDKKWLAIVNPASRNGKAKKKWHKKIKPLLEKLEVNFTEFITSEPMEAVTHIKSCIDQYDGFIAIGGDGISNEVLNGILSATVEVGKPNDKLYAIIPAGTGNDIANAFGLPYKKIEESCNLFISGKASTRQVDAGRIFGNNFEGDKVYRYFCGVFSSGFDAEVAHKTQRSSKWLPGTANYIKALLANIIRLNTKEFNIKIEGGPSNTSFTKEGILVAIGLGPYYGAGMKICPDAKVDDGLLNVTFINKVPRRTLLRVFPKVYDGKHVTHKSVELFEGSDVEIDTNKDTIWQVDGEIIGYTPVEIKCMSKVLNVLSTKINSEE